MILPEPPEEALDRKMCFWYGPLVLTLHFNLVADLTTPCIFRSALHPLVCIAGDVYRVAPRPPQLTQGQ